MSNTIIRNMAEEILALPVVQYSVIIDGTQDKSGTEQESICPPLRWFRLGTTRGIHWPLRNFFQPQVSKFLRLSLMCLLTPSEPTPFRTAWPDLWWSSQYVRTICREYRLTSEKNSHFLFMFTVGLHCVNLVTQAACSTTPIVRDALQWTHELGCLFGQSGKFKTISSLLQSPQVVPTSHSNLCAQHDGQCAPQPLTAILVNMRQVLAALEEMASSNTSDTASRANGLHERFQKGTTVLGLFLVKEVMMGLEGLNTSPQGRGKTIGGMLSAVDCVKKHFQSQRTEEAFTVYTSATDLVTSLEIEPIKMPHLRKPQRRHAGPAEPYVPSTDQEYYRVQFFQVLDIVTTQLTKRFEQEGLQHLVKLEKVLLSGQVNDVVDLYPELQFQSLKVQLAMFTANYTYKTCSEVTEIMRNMVPEVRGLFCVCCSLFLPHLLKQRELQCLETPEDLAALFNVTNPTQQCGCLSCSQRENV